MSKGKIGICAICGSERILTKDHLPPRNIFPKPQPNNVSLIKVPTCEECNGDSSSDDEKFKLFISLKSGMDNPHCLKLHNSAKETVQSNARLKRDLLENATQFYLKNSKTGLHEKVFLKQYDPKPILRIAEKIIRGLYHRHFGKPLTTHARCHICLEDMMDDEKKAHLIQVIEDMKVSGDSCFVGENNEFFYLYSGTECEYSTAWLLIFNETTYIFALTERSSQRN